MLSLWDDPISRMLWLDSTQPANSSAPGAKRGPCAVTSGDPKVIEQNTNTKVVYSNIKYGELGSTDKLFPPSPPAPPFPPPSPPPPLCAKGWAQCGGKGYTGPTCCATGFSCVKSNDYFSECTPSAETAETAKLDGIAEAINATAASEKAPCPVEAAPAPAVSRAAPASEVEAAPHSGTLTAPVFATNTRHSKVAI